MPPFREIDRPSPSILPYRRPWRRGRTCRRTYSAASPTASTSSPTPARGAPARRGAACSRRRPRRSSSSPTRSGGAPAPPLPPPSPRAGPSTSPPSSPTRAAASDPAASGSRSPSPPYLERRAVIVLLNPVTAAEIVLPPLIHDAVWVVSKVVFAPGPARDDFAAAAICSSNRVAYVTPGARRWAVLGPVTVDASDHLTDLVYDGEGKVYCLTRCGGVHVLRLPERRRRQPAKVHGPEFSLLQTPELIRRWTSGNLRPCDRMKMDLLRDVSDLFIRLSTECRAPDLNERTKTEPLLSTHDNAFAPPYDIVSGVTGAKNLVICGGILYQVWRNTSCTVTLQLPGGGRLRIPENEMFVLRYYPQRQPCWDVVKDLGGYSFFIGRNNAVSLYAEGVPGIRANCVYWIGGNGKDQGMVFDMETGSSTSCGAPVITVPGHPNSTVCWYFLDNMVTTSSSGGGRRNTLTAAKHNK